MYKEDQFWRDAAMPHVEARRSLNSSASYKPHFHSTISVGAVQRGESVLIDSGNMARKIGSGTVVWIPAYQLHSCNPLPLRAWSFQMLYLDPHWLCSKRPTAQRSSAATHAADGILISTDRHLYTGVCTLTDLLFSQAAQQSKLKALIAFMDALHTAAWEQMPCGLHSRHISHEIQVLLQKIQHTPSEEINWDEEARVAGCSRTQLIRAFKKMTGMTPHAWQQNARIIAARELLRSGHKLADVAYAQGFADQAHFQRVFKSLAGSTPGNYRA